MYLYILCINNYNWALRLYTYIRIRIFLNTIISLRRSINILYDFLNFETAVSNFSVYNIFFQLFLQLHPKSSYLNDRKKVSRYAGMQSRNKIFSYHPLSKAHIPTSILPELANLPHLQDQSKSAALSRKPRVFFGQTELPLRSGSFIAENRGGFWRGWPSILRGLYPPQSIQNGLHTEEKASGYGLPSYPSFNPLLLPSTTLSSCLHRSHASTMFVRLSSRVCACTPRDTDNGMYRWCKLCILWWNERSFDEVGWKGRFTENGVKRFIGALVWYLDSLWCKFVVRLIVGMKLGG